SRPVPTRFHPLSLHDALPISGHFEAGSFANQYEGAAFTPQAIHGIDAHAKGARKSATIHKHWGSRCIVIVSKHMLNRFDYECSRSEEHTSELQSRENLVCRLL